MSDIVFKRTKILATVGPSVNSQEKIMQLMQAGVNGFRLNFSHGDYDERRQQIAWIRQCSQELGKPVAILQDIQGPKIRLGNLKDDMRLPVKKGDELVLDSSCQHDGGRRLPVQYNLAEKVQVGEPIYMFDGKIRSTVIAIESDTALRVRAENDGTLMSRKGLNLPDTDFGGDILTPKDVRDIEFGAGQDIDYVAMSFVQTADDIRALRQRLLALDSEAHIVAKIETKAAIRPENLEDIVHVSDGVMVARGDLAVEAGAEVVPIVQKQIVQLCRKYGTLSIVATQMMASMVDNPEPTRAEVSDVANAVMWGFDTVMLSDETANGQYPIETVTSMKKVILYTQSHTPVVAMESNLAMKNHAEISYAAVQLANTLQAAAIIAESNTGVTAVNVAAFRPDKVILSVTDEQKTAQKLALSYANRSYVRPAGLGAASRLADELKQSGFLGEEQVTVVMVSGHQSGPGKTDNIQVRVV